MGRRVGVRVKGCSAQGLRIWGLESLRFGELRILGIYWYCLIVLGLQRCWGFEIFGS